MTSQTSYHQHKGDIERLDCRFHYISGTEQGDSTEISCSIASEIKESIDSTFPLAGDAVGESVFGALIPLSVPKLGSVDGALGGEILY